ncbi:MAG: hypothetical protein Q9162_003943 [Coniocarpon cinnabarinum]
MTTVDDGTSLPISTHAKAPKSLKSRIGSIFAAKSAPSSEPQIELKEPWRVYTRGDIVEGRVHLHVTRPLGITHLTVSLFGYLEVFKHHSRSQAGIRPTPVRVASGKGKRWVSEYYGDGFASLLDQEVTLCGQGRLDPNDYYFQFAMPFPSDRDFPTSIKFERGTVTYGIAVTMTRPTTIAPTVTNMEPVQYKQAIDVASLRLPKPRVVTLEPIVTSTRAKMVRRLTANSAVDDRSMSHVSSKSKVNSSRQSTITTQGAVDNGVQPPNSPVPSAPSTVSVSSAGRRAPSSPSEPRGSHSSQDAATVSQTSKENKTITATVKVLKGGVLPGDSLPLHIHIQHTKSIQSPAGIIVILYREARVDMHPNIPKSSQQRTDKDKNPQDYYPRSRTGLGGLSLSAAGSSQAWRKNLSHAVAPLYVDGYSKTATARPVIQIPEDVFPTMSGAPGDMIEFKYLVEVIIDIHGKGSTGSAMPNASISAPPSISVATMDGGLEETKHPTLSPDATSSSAVPRGAIRLQCDIIIGTQDSSRNKGKGKAQAQGSEASTTSEQAPTELATLDVNATSTAEYHPRDFAYGQFDGHDSQYYDPSYDDPRYYDYYNDNSHEAYDPRFEYQAPPWHSPQPLPPVPPPPNIVDEAHLSEKERLRRAEQTLLPSRPPGAEEALDASAGQAPSAPFLGDEALDVPAYVPPYTAVADSEQQLPVPTVHPAQHTALNPHDHAPDTFHRQPGPERPHSQNRSSAVDDPIALRRVGHDESTGRTGPAEGTISARNHAISSEQMDDSTAQRSSISHSSSASEGIPVLANEDSPPLKACQPSRNQDSTDTRPPRQGQPSSNA